MASNSDNNASSDQRPASGRRSTREMSSEDPLLAMTTSSTVGSSDYAVYQARRRSAPRSSLNGNPSQLPSPLSLAQSAAHSSTSVEQPPSPASAPFAPSTTSSIPPLVSRPSNSTLPAPSGRAYARSISEAQERLKAHVLTAELQSLGLSNESAGAAIVQKLANVGRDAEWQSVSAAIASGKTTLLLPSEKLVPTTQITPSFLLDHLALIEQSPSSRTDWRAFATMSGLRGGVAPDELVFISAFAPPSLSSTSDLSDAETVRSYLGAGSPALPSTSSDAFPSTMLVSNVTQLSIPRSLGSGRGDAPASRASTGARLAALFTKPLTSDSESTPARSSTSSHQNSTDTSASGERTSSSKTSSLPNLEASVLAIGKVIRHDEVVKATLAGSRLYLQKAVDEGDPSLSRVIDEQLGAFVERFQPPTEWRTIDEVSDAFQDAMEAVRSAVDASACGDEKQRQEPSNSRVAEIAQEERVNASLEHIEDAATSLMYDRLFLSELSDDAQQDENLSSRIAALNVLEISLEHLGLDLGDEGDDNGYGGEAAQVRDAIEEIMVDLGREFEVLQSEYTNTAKKKLDVLVNLHKIIVNHLAKMRVPIRLRKDSDAEAPAEVEMDDASMQSSRSQSGANTPDVDLAQRTPRARADAGSQSVTDLELPSAQLSSSMHDATSSSVFDRPSTPTNAENGSSKQRRAPSSSSADLILPLLIFAAVRFNPRLTSHLRFVQRFRTESLLRGEASYCTTNIQAVIEFLNHVDISTLGLDSQKVLAYTKASEMISASAARSSSSRRGGHSSAGHDSRSRRSTLSSRSQDIDRVVDTANQALVKAADMLFGPKGFAPRTVEDVKAVLDGAAGSVSKARGSLLRRATNASTLSTSEQAAAASSSSSVTEPTPSNSSNNGQRELVDLVPGSGDAYDAGLTSEYATRRDAKDEDAGSVRSVSSVLGSGGARNASTTANSGVLSAAPAVVAEEQTRTFGDRLASIPGLSRFGSGGSNSVTGQTAADAGKPASATMATSGSRSSIFSAFAREPASPTASRRTTISSITSSTSTTGSNQTTPVATTQNRSSLDAAATVNHRFLEMHEDELKVADVGLLLADYKRLAAAVLSSQT
ncbi:hypothetical protein ACM66B_001896 [Microbotryomycetes sp. NB124-2]